MKIFVVVTVLLGLAVAEESSTGGCYLSSDLDTGEDDTPRFRAVNNKIKLCLNLAFSPELQTEIEGAKTMEEFSIISRGICASSQQVATCLAEVRQRTSTCRNEKISTIASIMTDMHERLHPALCENEGERLAILIQGFMALKKDVGQTSVFFPCTERVGSILKLIGTTDIDFPSKTYLNYQTLRSLKKCSKSIQNESFQTTVDWLIDDLAAHFKCLHHDEHSIVQCSNLDTSKVKVNSVCDLPPLNVTHLYDHLQKQAVQCFSDAVNHDVDDYLDTADLEMLKDWFKGICISFQHRFRCRDQLGGFAEACLSEQEIKQFHLLMDTVNDILERGCVGGGEMMATIMHEVYRLTPEHGHAIRDCYKTVAEASKSDTTPSKNMRFYHSGLAFKQCLMGKLHGNNNLARDAEALMDDVLKKMNCIHHEDGTTMRCETIHNHYH